MDERLPVWVSVSDRLLAARMLADSRSTLPMVCPKMFFIKIIPFGFIRWIPSFLIRTVKLIGPDCMNVGAENSSMYAWVCFFVSPIDSSMLEAMPAFRVEMFCSSGESVFFGGLFD